MKEPGGPQLAWRAEGSDNRRIRDAGGKEAFRHGGFVRKRESCPAEGNSEAALIGGRRQRGAIGRSRGGERRRDGVRLEWPSVKGLGFRGPARLGWHIVSVLVLDFAKAVTGARQSRVGFGAAFNSPRFSSTGAFRDVVVGDLMEEILEELAAHGMVSSLEESFAEPADA